MCATINHDTAFLSENTFGTNDIADNHDNDVSSAHKAGNATHGNANTAR